MRFFLVIFFFLYSLLTTAQHFKITEDITELGNYTYINHSFCRVEMINDYNPIFTPRTNDDGYTLGMSVFTRIKNKNSPNFFDLQLRSDLYTQYLWSNAYQLGSRSIIPQNFVEISYLNFQYQYYLKDYKCYLSLGGGFGINNKKTAIFPLSLYLQGGIDGKGGYHELIHNNHGEDNVLTGGIEPLFFISPSVIKQFLIESENSTLNKPNIELQSGFRLGNYQIGNSVFFKTKVDIPLVQLIYKQSNLLLLSLLIRNELSYTQDGISDLPEFGSELELSFLTVGFTSIFNLGKQNISTIKYADNETLMRLYLQINF